MIRIVFSCSLDCKIVNFLQNLFKSQSCIREISLPWLRFFLFEYKVAIVACDKPFAVNIQSQCFWIEKLLAEPRDFCQFWPLR